MSATDSMTLPFDIASYWLHASGAGGGADFDLVMERDAEGLPLLRGRHVAGLLRLALERAAAWGWFAADDGFAGVEIVNLLMGARGGGGPGCLDIRDAIIAEPLRGGLRADHGLRAACFQRLATTAIDGLRGVARDQHLRTIEGAVPLPLHARVGFDAADRRIWCRSDANALGKVDEAARQWRRWIACAWPALDEVGAKRTRGFGRLRFVRCDGEAAS